MDRTVIHLVNSLGTPCSTLTPLNSQRQKETPQSHSKDATERQSLLVLKMAFCIQIFIVNFNKPINHMSTPAEKYTDCVKLVPSTFLVVQTGAGWHSKSQMANRKLFSRKDIITVALPSAADDNTDFFFYCLIQTSVTAKTIFSDILYQSKIRGGKY